METYDPLKAPNPEKRLALGESERIASVASYHSRARHRREPAAQDAGSRALPRLILMMERVDRHEAIHAVGSLPSEFIFAAREGEAPDGPVKAAYFAKLEKLTMAGWRHDFA